MLLHYIDTNLLYLYKRLSAEHPEKVSLLYGLPFYIADDELSQGAVECFHEFELSYLPELFQLIIPTTTRMDDNGDGITFILTPPEIKEVKDLFLKSKRWRMPEKRKFTNIVSDAYSFLKEFKHLDGQREIRYLTRMPKNNHITRSVMCNSIIIHMIEYFYATEIFYALWLFLKFRDGLKKAVRYGNAINNRYKEDDLSE